MSDATVGYAALQAKHDAYDLAWSFYTGARGEVFASDSLKRILRKTGERYRVNVIKSVPNAVADRLEVMSVTTEEVAQDRLDDIRRENNLVLEESNYTRKASVYGDYYGIVWSDGEEESDGVVVNGISPLSGVMVYDVDNPRRKLYFAHSWEVSSPLGDKKTIHLNLLYVDRIERWQSVTGHEKLEEESAWEPRPANPEDPDSWTEENPYGEVPVFHFRNDTPYGAPEHYDGYGAQDAVNKIVVSHLATVDFHIAPQRWALEEADNTDDDFDLDDDISIDDDEVDTPTTAGGKGLPSGPGVMQMLKNVSKVGQFDPADMSAFIDSTKFYVAMMAQTTSTPMDMLDDSGDEPSGESRRRKEAPLVKKVKDRQKTYAATWAELYSFALKVAGFADKAVEVKYAPAEVVSDAEGWSTVKVKIDAGVPPRQALLETGYPAEKVDEWFPDDAPNSFRVSDLVEVADILQKLGAAVALNIITEQEARALLPEGVFPTIAQE